MSASTLALRMATWISTQVLAKELIALQPDVILAHSTPVAAALQRESRAIPIVFVNVSDPIGSGFSGEPGATGRQSHGPADCTRRASSESGWRCSRRSRRAWRAPLS